MKTKPSVLVLLLILSLATSVLYADNGQFSYPDMTEQPDISDRNLREVDKDALMVFLDQWDTALKDGSAVVDPQWVAGSDSIGQLQSVYRMQEAQLEQLRREAKPVFSIMTDPSNPLYGYTKMKTITTGTLVSTESHQFGLGLGISQQLPTAGSIELTAKHAMSLTSLNGGVSAWKQSPSLGISLQQPLGVGDRLIDGSYGKKVEQKQLLQLAGASDAIGDTTGELAVQTMQLTHTLQALKESRWLLVQQVELEQDSLDRAELDYQGGLISRNELITRELSLQRLLNQIRQLEQEIESVGQSVMTISGQEDLDGLDTLVHIPADAIQRLFSYAGGNLPQDKDTLESVLQADTDYKGAQREMQIASLDKSLGSPGDAVRLSVAMQLSPFYNVTPGNSLWDSIDGLFTASDPNFSVSVSIMATDLSRSLRKTTDALVDEQMVQATLAMEHARRAVIEQFSQYQQEIDSGLVTLSVLLDTYQLAVIDADVAHIQAQSGGADRQVVRRTEIALYKAAFDLLQHLRSLRLLDARIALFLDLTVS